MAVAHTRCPPHWASVTWEPLVDPTTHSHPLVSPARSMCSRGTPMSSDLHMAFAIRRATSPAGVGEVEGSSPHRSNSNYVKKVAPLGQLRLPGHRWPRNPVDSPAADRVTEFSDPSGFCIGEELGQRLGAQREISIEDRPSYDTAGDGHPPTRGVRPGRQSSPMALCVVLVKYHRWMRHRLPSSVRPDHMAGPRKWCDEQRSVPRS